MYKSRVQKHKEIIKKDEAQYALGCASFGVKLFLATSIFTSKETLLNLADDEDVDVARCAHKTYNDVKDVKGLSIYG